MRRECLVEKFKKYGYIKLKYNIKIIIGINERDLNKYIDIYSKIEKSFRFHFYLFISYSHFEFSFQMCPKNDFIRETI